jgi:hypothetical protein
MFFPIGLSDVFQNHRTFCIVPCFKYRCGTPSLLYSIGPNATALGMFLFMPNLGKRAMIGVPTIFSICFLLMQCLVGKFFGVFFLPCFY